MVSGISVFVGVVMSDSHNKSSPNVSSSLIGHIYILDTRLLFSDKRLG